MFNNTKMFTVTTACVYVVNSHPTTPKIHYLAYIQKWCTDAC